MIISIPKVRWISDCFSSGRDDKGAESHYRNDETMAQRCDSPRIRGVKGSLRFNQTHVHVLTHLACT